MLSCGGALRWYRDTMGVGLSYDDLAAEAATIKPGSDGLTFLPYLTGERCPHNDPYARAAFAGLTLGHTHAHLSRAVFEGVSFGLLDGMNLLKGLGATAEEIRVTGGGARSGFWMQMLAELFEKPCVSLECDEGPAYGAAILAGVGVQVWPDVATACLHTVKIRNRIVPSGIDYMPSYDQYRKLYSQTRGWNPV
jgi:xylulokinase